MMTTIRKKQIFVILSGIHFPWYARSVFAWIYTFNFAQKKFYGRVNSFEFKGGHLLDKYGKDFKDFF